MCCTSGLVLCSVAERTNIYSKCMFLSSYSMWLCPLICQTNREALYNQMEEVTARLAYWIQDKVRLSKIKKEYRLFIFTIKHPSMLNHWVLKKKINKGSSIWQSHNLLLVSRKPSKKSDVLKDLLKGIFIYGNTFYNVCIQSKKVHVIMYWMKFG